MYGYQGSNSQPYSYQNPNGSSFGNISQYTGPYNPYYSNASAAYNAYPSNDQPRSSLGVLPQEYSPVGNGIPPSYFFDPNSSYPRPYQGLPFNQSMEIPIANSYDSCPRNCHCCESMKPKYFPPNNSIHLQANNQSNCDSSINGTYNGLRKGLNSGIWRDQLPSFQGPNDSSPSWSLPKCGTACKTEPYSWSLTQRQTGKFEGMEHLSPKVNNTYMLPQQHQRKALSNNQTVLNSNSLLPPPSTRPTYGRSDEHVGSCFSGYQYSSSDFQKNLPEMDIYSKQYVNKIPASSRVPCNLSNNFGGGFSYKFSTPHSKNSQENQKCNGDSPKLVTPLPSAIGDSMQRRLPPNSMLDGTNETAYCQPGMVPFNSVDGSSRRLYDAPTDSNSRFAVNFSSSTSDDSLHSRLPLTSVQSFRPSNVLAKLSVKNSRADFSHIPPRMHGKTEYERECRSNDNGDSLSSSNILKNLCLMNSERMPGLISSEDTSKVSLGHENDCLPINHGMKSASDNVVTLLTEKVNDAKLPNCKDIALKPSPGNDSAVIQDLRHFLTTWDDGDDDETNSAVMNNHSLSNDCASGEFIGVPRACPTVDYPIGKADESHRNLYGNSPDDVRKPKEASGTGDYESIVSYKEFSNTTGNHLFHDQPRTNENITNGAVDNLNISQQSPKGLRKLSECDGMNPDINAFHSDTELKPKGTFEESSISQHDIVNTREVNGITADVMVKECMKNDSSIILNTSLQNGSLKEKLKMTGNEEETTENQDSHNSSSSETISPSRAHLPPEGHYEMEKLSKLGIIAEVITEKCNEDIPFHSKEESGISKLAESLDILLKEGHESCRDAESSDNSVVSSQSNSPKRSSNENNDALMSHSSSTKIIVPQKFAEAPDVCSWVKMESNESITEKYPEGMSGERKDIVEIEDITSFGVRSSCELTEENLNSVNDECHETGHLIPMKEYCSETNVSNEVNTASTPQLSSLELKKNLLKDLVESSDGDRIISIEKKVLTDELPPSVEYSLHGNLLHENSLSVGDDHAENHLGQNSKVLRENVIKCKSGVLPIEGWQSNKESKKNSSSLSPCRDETVELKDTMNKKGCRKGCVKMPADIIKKLSHRAALLIVRKYIKINQKNKMRLRNLRGWRNVKGIINRKGTLVISRKRKYSSKKKNFCDDFGKKNSLKVSSRTNGIKLQKINSNASRCLTTDPLVLAGGGVDVEGLLSSVCDSDTKVNHSNENSRQTESYGGQNAREYPDYNHIKGFPIDNPLHDLLPREERVIHSGSYVSNLLIGNKEVFMGIGGDVDSFEEAAERENLDVELRSESYLHEDATNGYYWGNYEIGNDLGVAMEIVVGSDTQSGDNVDLKQELIGKVNTSSCPEYKEPERSDKEEDVIHQREFEMNCNKARAVGDENTCDDSERNVISHSSVKEANENESTHVEVSCKEHIREANLSCRENVIFRLNEGECEKEIEFPSCSLSEKGGQTVNTGSGNLKPKHAIIVATLNKCHNELDDLDIENHRLPESPRSDIIGASDLKRKCLHNVSEMNQQKVGHSRMPEKSIWSAKSIKNKYSTFLKSCKNYRSKLGNIVNSDCKSGINVSHNHSNVNSDSTFNGPLNCTEDSSINLYSTAERKETSAVKNVSHLSLSNETNSKNDGIASMISCDTGVHLKKSEGIKKKFNYVNDEHSITKEADSNEIIRCSSSKPTVQKNEVNFCKKEILKEENKNKVIAKAKSRKTNKFYCNSKDVAIKSTREVSQIIHTSSSVDISQCMDIEQVPVKENSRKVPKHGPKKKNSFKTKASLKCFGGFRFMSVQYHRRGLWRNKKWPYNKTNAKSQQYLPKNTSKVPRLSAPELYPHSLPHILGLCSAFPPPPLSPLPVLSDALSTSHSPCNTAYSNLNPTDCPLQSDGYDGHHVNGVSDVHALKADQHSSDSCEISISSLEPIIPESQTHQDTIGINSKEEIISAVEVSHSDPLESTLAVSSNENTMEFSKLSQASLSPECGAPIAESSPLGSHLDNVQPIDDIHGIEKPIESDCSTQNSSMDLLSLNPETPHVCITLKKIGCVDVKKIWKKRPNIKNNSKNLQDFDMEEVKKMGSSEGESSVPKVTIKKKSGEMGYQSFLSGFSSASPSPTRSPTITSKPEFPPHIPLSGEDTSARKCSEVPTKSVSKKSVTGDSSPLMTDVKSEHHSQVSEHLRRNYSSSSESSFSKTLVEKKEGNGLKFVIRGLGDKLKEYSVRELGARTEISPSKESNHAQNNSMETSEYSVTSGDDGWESGPWSIWQPVVKLSRSCELDALARELNSMDEDNGCKRANVQECRRVKKIRHSSKKRNEQYRSCGSRDDPISVTDKVKGHMNSNEKLCRKKCDEGKNSKVMFSRKSHRSESGADNEELSKIQSSERSHCSLPHNKKKLKSESSFNDLRSMKKPLIGNISTSCKKGERNCELDISRIKGVRKTSRDGRDILKSHSKIIRNSKEVSSGNKSHEWPMKNKSENCHSSIPNIPSEKSSSSVEAKDKKKRTWDGKVKEKCEQKDKQVTVEREGISINSGDIEVEKEVKCQELSLISNPGSKVRDLPSKDTLSNILDDNIGPKSKENGVKNQNVSCKIQVPQKEDFPAKKRVCETMHPERCVSSPAFSCEACSRKFSSQKWLSRHCKGVSHSRVENAQRQAVQALMLLFTGNESSLLQPLTEKEHSYLRNWSTHAVPSPLQLALKEFLNST